MSELLPEQGGTKYSACAWAEVFCRSAFIIITLSAHSAKMAGHETCVENSTLELLSQATLRYNLLSSAQILCMSRASRQNLHFASVWVPHRGMEKLTLTAHPVFSSKLRFAKEDFAVVASGVAFSMASQERAHGHRRVEVCASGHPVAPFISTARSYSLSQRLVAVARCPSRFRVRVIMNVMGTTFQVRGGALTMHGMRTRRDTESSSVASLM